MALYCGLDFYTTEDINSLIQEDVIDGIVLGDWFCQRKMFEYGESQLYDYINIVGRSLKKLVYQTPIYITSRNRMQVIDTIKYIDTNFADSVILTQDIVVVMWKLHGQEWGEPENIVSIDCSMKLYTNLELACSKRNQYLWLKI